MAMKRREFILKLGAAALVLPSVVLKGCGGSSSDDPYYSDDDDAGDDDSGGCLGDAIGNANSHGHVISIPRADLDAPPAGGATYSASGSHSHNVTLSQQELVDLAANCTLATSNNSGHAHTWTITVASS